jgi:cell division protein FtsI/penicillin-binding protein 2
MSFGEDHLTQYRLRVVSLLIPFIFIVIVARLFYWQIIRGPEMEAKASRQHETVTTLKAKRGNILDSEGNVLVGSKNLYHLYVYKPQLEIGKDELVNKLMALLEKTETASTESQLRDYLNQRLDLKSNWISIKHFLSPEEKNKIKDQKIVGIGFEDEFVRYYPESSMSAHILGFVGQDMAGQEQGYFGLEGFYDRWLKGREGKVRTEKDASGNPILIGNYQFYNASEGKSVQTTIDKKVQYLTEQLLKEGIEKYQALAGNVTIIETSTGKVRAMASFPNYDPSKFSEFPSLFYKNPIVADLFEPGSVFKVLVMAAGFNEKVVTPETQCDICASPVIIGKYSIRTWDETYRENASMTDVIVHSDNTGMVFVARKLGGEKFLEYLKLYGFGKKTGIQLQDEVGGSILSDGNKYRDIDLATNSFGQGIAITPLQMTAAANTIANGGVYISPTLIENEPGSKTNVLSKEAAVQMTQVMKLAVENGEAKWSKPKNLSVAGKTGTAQIPIEGKYDLEKTIASFVGFFPAENPKYTMLVTLREPKTSTWGSETAAPLWFNIAKQLLL